MRTIVLLPVYNEASTLAAVLEGLVAASDAVIAIDDGSRDGSPGILEDWAGRTGRLQVIRMDANAGKSRALEIGFREVLKRLDEGLVAPADAVVTMDADGQIPPSIVGEACAVFSDRRLDMLIGARDFRLYPLVKRLGNAFITRALLIQPPLPLGDFQLRDSTGGVVTREALRGHWTLMALAPGETAVRPWLQQLAAIFNHLASEPELQGHLILAPRVPAGEAADNLVPATPPWRLLRGSDAEITELQDQLGLAPPHPTGSANPELGELLW